MRVLIPAALLFLACAALATPARADGTRLGKYRFQPGGKVTAVRTADVDRDGRPDLVALVTVEEDGRERQEVLVLRTPATPRPGVFYGPENVTRIRADREDVRAAGALAVGAFGPEGAFRLRFLGRRGLLDLDAAGRPVGLVESPTLLGRSGDRPLVFWDQHADLDQDGIEEIYFPEGEGSGAMRVESGAPGEGRTLDLVSTNRGVTDYEHLIRRHAYVPTLQAADLDGDGRLELLTFRSPALVAWPYDAEDVASPVAPAFEVALPFVKENLGPDEVHTPRLRLADADGDGIADLLVTLVTGSRRQLGSFRTRLLHYRGPFRDPATGALTEPRVRIDTESVALHTHFEDLDGDGDIDYLTDSIRGTKVDLLKRLFGQPPTMWYVAFRFDGPSGTYETVPYFSLERPYSLEETVSNKFGRTGFFEGDLDGDGHRDVLDLGDLGGLEILRASPRTGRGPGDPVSFTTPILSKVRVPKPLLADAIVEDLSGDGRADAVVWSADTIYLLVSGAGR